MKKILIMLLVAAGIGGTVAAQDTQDNAFITKKVKIDQFVHTLIVNDDVNVVFTDELVNEIVIEGRLSDVKKVNLDARQGILEISEATGLLQKKRAVVYVPAIGITNVTVNGSSMIASYETLRNANMTIWVNGACEVVVKSYGKVNVIASDEYSFNHVAKSLASTNK